jgi:hypothetical protein
VVHKATRPTHRKNVGYKRAMAQSRCPNQPFIARLVSGLFFPQRIALKLDGRSYSPAVLKKAITASAHAPSYQLGSKLLEIVGEIKIEGRQLNKLAVRIGTELTAARDAVTAEYFDQPLPRQSLPPKTPIVLASVSCDGGRMQTRQAESRPGVHDPHWRETKNALFLRMNSDCFEEDPHPQLPACFADRRHMKELLVGVNVEPAALTEAHNPPEKLPDWRPQVLFRSCLSSLTDSNAFGQMMVAEADARGFYCARKQSYVADGLPYNWTIQQRHFPTFTPILDFVHAVEHLYAAARAVSEDDEATWQRYVPWAETCWQGGIGHLIIELREHQQKIGSPPTDCEGNDPRKILAEAIGYFQNNTQRMKYPQYRCDGLPITSAHMESFVKELNYRVKSTEKFWNDGPSGEAILQIRAATLNDDDRLTEHLNSRPGNPFHPNARLEPPSLAAAA